MNSVCPLCPSLETLPFFSLFINKFFARESKVATLCVGQTDSFFQQALSLYVLYMSNCLCFFLPFANFKKNVFLSVTKCETCLFWMETNRPISTIYHVQSANRNSAYKESSLVQYSPFFKWGTFLNPILKTFQVVPNSFFK